VSVLSEYERRERELLESPATWIPGLLAALVEMAVKRRVWQEDGLVQFVQRIVDRLKGEGETDG
jgi:hypothetical protein